MVQHMLAFHCMYKMVISRWENSSVFVPTLLACKAFTISLYSPEAKHILIHTPRVIPNSPWKEKQINFRLETQSHGILDKSISRGR